MAKRLNSLRTLPSVDSLLKDSAYAALIAAHGRPLVVHAIQETLAAARISVSQTSTVPTAADVLCRTAALVESLAKPSLRPVINATGVVLHTNLGRAPLGASVLDEVSSLLTGYSNVEFDLKTGKRGLRDSRVAALVRYLTGAQDCLVVNNNAASLVLILNTLCRQKEVIVSRGELVEIGGAFRIPEIMKAGGAKMVEVGTTNRTRLSDYEKAITPKTGLIFKAHKSNYAITGFTEEVSVGKLSRFAHDHGRPFVYDIGSGLLRKPAGLGLKDEPDVRSAIADGADLVAFSCDKLLGGPQAGIVAGRAELVAQCAAAPLMRAFRVGKLVVATLEATLRHYLSDETLKKTNPTFAMLSQSSDQVRNRAQNLKDALDKAGVPSEVVVSNGQVGGGSLPDCVLSSFAVTLIPPGATSKANERFAERVFHGLLDLDRPVLGVLREGRFVLDMFAVRDAQIDIVASAVAAVAADGRRS